MMFIFLTPKRRSVLSHSALICACFSVSLAYLKGTIRNLRIKNKAKQKRDNSASGQKTF